MTDQYKEISLTNYIKVAIKRKKRIALTTIIVLILSGLLFPYSGGALYETESTLFIGTISGELVESKDETKAFILTEVTAKDMLEFINPKDASITKSEIQRALKYIKFNGEMLAAVKTKAELEAAPATPGNFINIAYQDTDPERVMKGVAFLQDFIIKRHQKIYDEKIKFKEERLVRNKKYLDYLYDRINTVEKIMSDLTNLRYPAGYTIAQGASITAHVELRDKLLAEARGLEEQIYKETIQLKDEITKVISPAIKPMAPVKKASTTIRIGVAVLLGLFLGIIFAFLSEWWNKNRDELKNV